MAGGFSVMNVKGRERESLVRNLIHGNDYFLIIGKMQYIIQKY